MIRQRDGSHPTIPAVWHMPRKFTGLRATYKLTKRLASQTKIRQCVPKVLILHIIQIITPYLTEMELHCGCIWTGQLDSSNMSVAEKVRSTARMSNCQTDESEFVAGLNWLTQAPLHSTDRLLLILIWTLNSAASSNICSNMVEKGYILHLRRLIWWIDKGGGFGGCDGEFVLFAAPIHITTITIP